MGSLWIQVLPLNPADLETLEREFSPKMLRDDIAGNEKWLEVEPANPRLHAELAACYVEMARLDEAVIHLKEALRLDPTAGRHYDLGLALLTQRKFDQAKDAFDSALNLKADFPEALLNLGVVAHQQGQLDEAVAYYTRARQHGLDDTAVHYNLGRAYTAQGKYAEAIAEYRRTVELQPNDAEALIGLAWVLVAADRAELRNPSVAVRLAELAADLTQHRDAMILDTLAATYMATGAADRAIKTAEAALVLATAAGDEGLASQLRLRLDFYRQHK
jgi:tetratricopeptide (TPR) repeat protein